MKGDSLKTPSARLAAIGINMAYVRTTMRCINKLELNDEEADIPPFSILFDLRFSGDFQLDKLSPDLPERKSEVLASFPTWW